MNQTIGMTYDLRSDYVAQGYSEDELAEFDTDETIDLLEEAIRSLGYDTDRIGNGYTLCQRLAAGDRWDLVFNIAEGLHGRCREAQVPALLEMFDIGYTFSDPLTCAASLDKSIAKKLVRAQGIPTPKFQVIRRSSALKAMTLEFPVFVKPLAEGTGKGITSQSRVDNFGELEFACRHIRRQFSQPALIEEFLPGREFTVGLIGNYSEARAIGVTEVIVKEAAHKGIYSYDAKEGCESQVLYGTLREGALRRHVAELALKAYRTLECRDAARVDFRCDEKGEPFFMEINPLPGLHPSHSDLPIIATQQGIRYKTLIEMIIEAAQERLEQEEASWLK